MRIGFTDEAYADPRWDMWIIDADYATHLAPFGARSFGFVNSQPMPEESKAPCHGYVACPSLVVAYAGVR